MSAAEQKAARVEALQKRIAECQAAVSQLQANFPADVDPQKLVDEHINLLHKYNERRDAAQMLIGRIAAIQQVTVADVYKQLGLDVQD